MNNTATLQSTSVASTSGGDGVVRGGLRNWGMNLASALTSQRNKTVRNSGSRYNSTRGSLQEFPSLKSKNYLQQ